MKVHDLNGNEFDIDRAEAERIAGELAKLGGHETNEAFLNRALDNIQSITGVRPRTEDDLKVLLYQNTSNTNMHDINLIYEAVEAIVGWHKKKVG
jgi:DNA-directed RNA polymerase subunit F